MEKSLKFWKNVQTVGWVRKMVGHNKDPRRCDDFYGVFP